MLSTFLVLSIFMQVFYLQTQQDTADKKRFCQLTQTSNLSVSNEARYVRFRNEMDTFSLFSESPEIRTYFPSTYTYNYSSLLDAR